MDLFPRLPQKVRVFVTAILLVFCAGIGSLAAQPSVLLVHSYHDGYRWTRTLDRTLKAEIREDFPETEFFVEYMDSKRHSVETIAESFVELLRTKYADRDLDIVAVTDNPALELVLSSREELFGTTPVVFSGVNDYRPGEYEQHQNLTGIAERPDIAGTVEIALELHPEAERLVGISDSTVTGRINQRKFEGAVAELGVGVDVVNLSGMSRSELENALRDLPENSVVLNLSLFRTADGATFSAKEGSRFIISHTEAPVYTAWDLMLGTGAVGGLVVSAEGQATAQAEAVKKILFGASAHDIPVATDSTNRYSFDYEALEHHGIDSEELPAGSTIVNEPENMWYRYQGYIVSVGAAVLVLLILVVALLTNTVRRRAAERRLTRSERKYRSVFESLHDVYFEVTKSRGKILTVSPSVRKFGFEPEQLAGRNVADLNIPLELRRRLTNRITREGAVDDYEVELRTADGTPFTASISAHLEPALDIESKPGEKIVGTIRDVSERRRLGEELKRLHKAIEEAGHAVYITDPHGVIQYVNPAFEKTTGYSRNEAIGRTPRLFSSGKISEHYYARLWGTIKAGQTWQEQIVNRRRDGSLYYASQTIAPVLNESGGIEWFVAIQTDETERVESERRYRLLAENATDMIATHAPDGTFTYVSPASRYLLGYEPSELLGVNSYTLFHPEDIEHISANHRFIEQGPEVSTVSYRIRRKDGTYTWFETTSKTIWDEDAGAMSEIITVSRDVSERIKMENHLKEAKSQAEAASQAKSEFVANVSHEIRTPLHAIMGYAELMRRKTEDETFHRYITTVEDSANTLLKLLNDILDLSKVEAGRLDITPEFADIRQLVTSVIALFEPQAREQEVPLQPHVSPEVPPLLYYDRVRVQQALVNLIGNALKFTESGHVGVTVDGRYTDDDRYDLTITVDDTGGGIPEEAQAHIFDAFSQGETNTARSHGGTGLGLAITQRLVERMGGTVEAQSREGEGSTFRIALDGLAYREGESDRSNEAAEESAEDEKTETRRRAENKTKTEVETKPGTETGAQAGVEALAPGEQQELKRAVKKQIVPDWKRIREVKMLDEIVDFGTRIEALGSDFGAEDIRENGRRLADAAGESDIETMERELKRFRTLVQSLEIDLG